MSDPVRRTARAYGRPVAARGASPGEGDSGEKGDAARRAILDATLGSFSEFGWSGTNMSVIARRSGMTRGRIQYYFPTLDELLRAAIEHLLQEWRKRYFASITEAVGGSARFDAGIAALWDHVQDPLHHAKQELEATARTNPELAALLELASSENDEASFQSAKSAYPELGRHGDDALRRARDFTMVFMEGLSIHRFGANADARRETLIGMLREFLVAYWGGYGVASLEAPTDDG